MDRVDGRFSAQNYFKKHPYEHVSSTFCSHILWAQNSEFRSCCSDSQQFISSSFAHYLSPDDLVTYTLMKVFQLTERILKKLFVCITKGKHKSDTLEIYVLNQGMEAKWLENNFTDIQMQIIRQNPDCDNFDLTLTFRCLDVFKDIIDNTKLKNNIVTTLEKLTFIKILRNKLSHNKVHVTKSQCYDIVHKLRIPLAELIEIIHTWDKDMDIAIEKKETEAAIDEITNGVISKVDFIYLCLQKVINSVGEPALNNVTKIICNDKTEDNFKEYLLRKGMKRNKYKDYFFKEEKKILESKFEERPDVTLHTKLIALCIEWHPLIKYDFEVRKELTSTIKKIKNMRNYVFHNMLSLSPEECIMESNMFRDSLNDLGKLMQNKFNMEMDPPIININQLDYDINAIMSIPYPYP